MQSDAATRPQDRSVFDGWCRANAVPIYLGGAANAQSVGPLSTFDVFPVDTHAILQDDDSEPFTQAQELPMDRLLFDQWQNAAPPFNGLTLHPDDLVPLADLTSVINVIVQRLLHLFPSAQLYSYHDWHEHDGYISARTSTSWAVLHQLALSEQQLYDRRSQDTYVRLGFYPTDCVFLFRVYVLDEDEDTLYPGRWGDFDLTGTDALIAELRNMLQAVIRQPLLQEPAKAYFDLSYAG